jgi:hypothetical protein
VMGSTINPRIVISICMPPAPSIVLAQYRSAGTARQ